LALNAMVEDAGTPLQRITMITTIGASPSAASHQPGNWKGAATHFKAEEIAIEPARRLEVIAQDGEWFMVVTVISRNPLSMRLSANASQAGTASTACRSGRGGRQMDEERSGDET
jgi:hypothetical protein